MDRNGVSAVVLIRKHLSLSARRAWIEMLESAYKAQIQAVALRKESVDRNLQLSVPDTPTRGRSPQGERG